MSFLAPDMALVSTALAIDAAEQLATISDCYIILGIVYERETKYR